MPSPSELEGVVLGIIHSAQPCTPYTIRQELRDSPSTYWSASAGAIYPLIKRLTAKGWVTSTPDVGDPRGRHLLRLRAAGRRALRAWTLTGSETEVVDRMYDSLRLRMFALNALEPEERRSFLRNALAAAEALHEKTQQHLEARSSDANEFERLANLGAVYEARARVQWMEEVVNQVR